jgi:hypothetical protein
MILQDQLVVWPFLFFTVESLLFFYVLPTTPIALAYLATPAPQAAQWTWGLGLFQYISWGMDMIGWFALKAGAIILLIFGIFIVPFSVVAWMPGLAVPEYGALMVFAIGLLFKLPAIVDTLIKLLTAVAQGVMGVIGGLASLFGL